jgi:exodeoxyribonuclease-5
MIFNKGQVDVINAGLKFIKDANDQVFQFAGNPGTGKSVVLGEIIRQSGLSFDEILPMAYTGTAANVMRKKGLINAKTIMSALYEAIEVPLIGKDGKPVMNTYLNKPVKILKFIPKPTPGIKLFVFDEGSMIPMHMKEEIESRGIPIIVTGDLDQLPPIDDHPAYLSDGKVMVLTEIMRQALDSPIIYLSQRAKHGLPIHCGSYGNEVYVLERDDLRGDIKNQAFANAQIVLCGKNRTRDDINAYVRSLHGYSGMLPNTGEKVVCRKNNHFIQADGITLSNGLLGYVMNSPDPSAISKEGTYRLDFMSFMGNEPFYGLNADFKYFNGSYEEKKQMRNSQFANQAGEKFELAYSITVHLSQGSQYDNGIYFEEFLNSSIQPNLNYTAISRFERSMIYIKQPIKKFF